MSDESSDDEPMLSSPDPSDDEDETHNDVFKYTARKFQKVNNSSPPSPARRKRHHVDTIQEKLSLLEHQQHARDLKLRKRLNGDNEDSSEDEEEGSSNAAGVINALQAKQQSLPTNVTTIDISDDSDDDDNAKPSRISLTSLKAAPKEVIEVLQRSQIATNRLKEAQLYHAEDLEVEMETTPIDTPLRKHAAAQRKILETPKPINLGKKLRLTCRCQLKVNGNKQPTAEQMIIVHENQPLSALMDKVMNAYSLPPTARVVLTFDGLMLEMKRTADSYQMEDGDLVDVTASVIAMPTPIVDTVSSGPRLTLTLRSKLDKKVQETSMQVGKNEIFQNLLNQYISKEKIRGKCILRFDGEVLGLDQTPSNYDMEDGDLIDVVQ